MKRFVFIALLSICMGCGSSLPSAGPSQTMMNQADKIILSVNDEPDAAYRSFKKYLNENDFVFSETSEQNLSLKTEYIPIRNNSSSEISINAEVKSDSTTRIYISGRGYSSEDGNEKLENRKYSTSKVTGMWIRLVQLASAYPHNTLYYGRNLDDNKSPNPYQGF